MVLLWRRLWWRQWRGLGEVECFVACNLGLQQDGIVGGLAAKDVVHAACEDEEELLGEGALLDRPQHGALDVKVRLCAGAHL